MNKNGTKFEPEWTSNVQTSTGCPHSEKTYIWIFIINFFRINTTQNILKVNGIHKPGFLTFCFTFDSKKTHTSWIWACDSWLDCELTGLHTKLFSCLHWMLKILKKEEPQIQNCHICDPDGKEDQVKDCGFKNMTVDWQKWEESCSCLVCYTHSKLGIVGHKKRQFETEFWVLVFCILFYHNYLSLGFFMKSLCEKLTNSHFL